MQGRMSIDRFVRAAANDVRSEDEDCLTAIERVITWLDEAVDDLPEGAWDSLADRLIQVFDSKGGVD